MLGHSLWVGSTVSLARGNASLVEMQVDGRWKDSRLPSHYASAVIAKNSATARIKYGKGRRSACGQVINIERNLATGWQP